MLDKSLPYYNIIMKRKTGAPLPDSPLPEGYAYQHFQDGDEVFWSEIMVSVGEFDSYEEALAYFETEYLPWKEGLEQRLIFVVDPHGHKVGTLTNWWNETQGRRDPSVHWVGVKPAHRGLEIGKALVFKGMQEMIALEGDRDYYLHTQTWSHVAIKIYQLAGYDFVKDETFGGYQNDYALAIEALRDFIK